MKKAKAFTIVELLTVIAVISILVGLTIPALNHARWVVREMAVKADFKNYEVGLNSFHTDMGYYPSSTPRNAIYVNPDTMTPVNIPQQGADILYESLVGIDQIGYQKDHFYYLDPATAQPQDATLNATTRSDLYVEINPERIGSLKDCYPDAAVTDVKTVFVDGMDAERPRPILYYRANPNGDFLFDPDLTIPPYQIYDYRHNMGITGLPLAPELGGSPAFQTPPDHGITVGAPPTTPREYFLHYILNPNAGTMDFRNAAARPYRADKFLLISAGRDGIFGPNPADNYKIDDITNFKD
ncbi:MAG: prepilin-type N-terminal cleavage/methylation domain-containing protein [Planctomycetes bacterium]|nr:prepilin-type N-terminal cleavage/methylation domain-containing protein [Planctomycetota bacterium]